MSDGRMSGYIFRSMLLLAITLEVKTQIFDIFQGFQPLVQPYRTAQTTTHRKQYQFIYTPTEKSSNDERRDENTNHNRQHSQHHFGNTFSSNSGEFPNQFRGTNVNRKSTSIYTSTTNKPPKRYSSHDNSNRNSNNVRRSSNKQGIQGVISPDADNNESANNNIRRKMTHEESANQFDTYYAIRPLYKTTKPPISNNKEEADSNLYNKNYYNSDTKPNQKHYNDHKPNYESYTTEKQTYYDRTNNNRRTTRKPVYNNDRNHYNTYTTAKPVNNYDITNQNSYTTENLSHNNDKTHDRHTTSNPVYNHDRNDFNSVTTEKASYNNEEQFNNRHTTDNHSHTTTKPAYNKDRTNYDKVTTAKPTYNNFWLNHDTTMKPASNHNYEDNERPNHNDQPSLNRHTTSTTKHYNQQRPDYESYNHDTQNYNNKRPIYNNDSPNYNSESPNYSNERPNYNNERPNYNNERPNYNNERPNYNNESPNYNNQRPDYNNERPDHNTYTTKNPFAYRPGVKPAVTGGPPITNRPFKQPSYNFGHNDDAILFPEDPNSAPEIVSGPDVDQLSDSQRRRYIEMTELMCDRYKSLDISQVAAIPLLPSPVPVTFNVSDCNPLSSPLIVGGKVVNIEQFPHNAAIGWQKTEGGGYLWKCGGSLISELFVLTAAHCSFQERDDNVVSGPPRVVQLGSSYLDDPGALVMRVTLAVRHPRYKLPSSYYDIALLKLASAVKFSEVIKPACLGVPPPPGQSIIATGWGRTEFGGEASTELRGVSVPIWEMGECSRVLGTSRKLPGGPSALSQVCAGEVRGGKDTCQGDSGGPAQIQDGCAWRIIGVTSLGRACGAPKTPAVYATTPREFIAAVLNSYK